jgi:HTH-type transcriptional repressor of puuD
MFTLWVTLQVRPDQREVFLEAIRANAAASVRDEPGCLSFDVIELAGGDNRFAFYERYVDADAFEVGHKGSAHFADWRRVAEQVVVPGSQVNTFGELVASEPASAGATATEVAAGPAGPQPSAPSCLVLRPSEIEAFDRGSGVRTIPYVGKWNTPANESNRVTTGMTVFAPGTGIPLHAHNVEESVLVLAGQATAVIGDERFDLEAGQATWVPAGIPHCFINRGDGDMTIYWVYGGRDVTRTITATGETFEHLSASDRGATPAPSATA